MYLDALNKRLPKQFKFLLASFIDKLNKNILKYLIAYERKDKTSIRSENNERKVWETSHI